MTLGIAPKRAKPRWLTLLVAVVGVMLMTASIALAGTVGTNAGFQDDDGNLNDDAAGIDWNSFATTAWTGTAPFRTSSKTFDGWTFAGIEDAAATTTDTAFAGGTKQDDNCATVGTGKAPNKDDLKRIYLATKVVSVSGTPHTFLELAWVRIPQNTTSPSAHVGFEFNKGTTPCGSGSDGLVQRVAGDMLVVYDFEGGSTDIPQITVRRWVLSGACEVGSSTAPCWGPATNLTASGFAEAKVNTFGSVDDTISPISPTSTTLGTSEFGEAGIDLTAANIFAAGSCQSFGKAFGVSRSSGNSGTAQMKDLVGPADFTIANCGQVKIIKRTNPRGLNQAFSFTSTIPAASTCTADTTPATFSLNDNGNTNADSAGNTENCTDVPQGTYTVTEGADPAGFVFNNFSCTTSGTGTSATPTSSTTQKNVSITVAAGGVVTCVYTNDQQLGAIKITKTSSKDSSGLDGATFSITSGGNAITGSPFTTANGGVVCVDNLAFGDYVVTETGAPTGYQRDDTTSHTVKVDNNAKCSDTTFGGETISFADTPLSEIEVKFKSLAGAGVTAASIVCEKPVGTDVAPVSENGSADPAFDDTDEVFTNLAPGTYTCIVVVDP